MSTSTNDRVRKHREGLRQAGLRPVQIWVPDTRRPDFARKCRRQCRLIAQADTVDTGTHELLDAALSDTEGWTR